MTEMIVLLDFKTEEGETRGMVLDLGTDLFMIVANLRMMAKQVDFLGAFVLSIEREKPTEPYIPPNGFAMTYNDDSAIQHPQLGTVWTSLVAQFGVDSFDEEE